MKRIIALMIIISTLSTFAQNSNILSDGTNLDDKFKVDTSCNSWNKLYELYQEKIRNVNTNNTLSNKLYNRNGGGIYLTLNQQIAKFKGYDNTIYPSCCTSEFGNVSNLGWGFRGSYDREFTNNFIFGLELGFHNLSSELTAPETLYFSNNGELTQLVNTHYLTNSIYSLELTPSISYKINKEIGIKFGLPLNYIVSATTKQKEQLEANQFFTFKETNSLIRNEVSGNIPNMNSLLYGISGAMNYEFKINSTGTDFIVPEISYNLNLNKLSSKLDWSWSTIRLGVSYKVSPEQTIDTIDYRRIYEEYQRDLLIIEKYKILACTPKEVSIEGIGIKIKNIFGVNNSGEKVQLRTVSNQAQANKLLTIDQIRFNGAHTILNYVFFEENTHKIPAKYFRINDTESMSFNENSLVQKNTMEVYYNILNIIGSRLAKDASAKITLTGYNSNTGTEENNTELSKRRAEEVKDYLERTFKIRPQQVSITFDNLPKRYTKSKDKFADEENRRVEISANKPSILSPILVKDQNLSSVNYEKIIVESEVSSGQPIQQMSQEFTSSEKLYSTGLEEDNYGKKVQYNRELSLKGRNDLINLITEDIDIEVKAIDIQGNQTSNGDRIVVDRFDYARKEQLGLNDKTIENYIVLLPYDDAGISDDNRDMVYYAKSRLVSKNSQMTVKGFTDAIGSTEKNNTLSQERAEKIARILELKNTKTEGLGVSKLFDNNLPEGRFYNRRVEIEIETPIIRKN